METWKPTKKNQKQYPHFDAPLSLEEMGRIANDPVRVAKNRFFPFLRYENSFRPYRPTGKDIKTREIRYGSRRDAAIFSRYRHGLSQLYEAYISKLGISDCVLAYRRIPVKPGSSSGKCNIHHAKEAFDRIQKFDECCAITLDISGYFESLDHERIKEIWCRLLGESSLPPDHYAVFKALTKYRIVDGKLAYEALGFFGEGPSGTPGYLVPRDQMPKQLCSPQEFRDKICGEAPGFGKLVTKHKEPYGIPQGAPLSDLLANAYLVDFDVEMMNHVNSFAGYYTRYSDDLLFIIPGGVKEAETLMTHVRGRIPAFGDQLNIKETKCFIDKFNCNFDGMKHQRVYPEGKRSNGLNYLGFRFDGKRIYLRDGTLSNFRRKMALAVRGEVYGLVKRFPGKDVAFLESQLNPDKIIEKFGRVREFEVKADKHNWTFWTYVKRADKIFGKRSRIFRQVSGYRDEIRKRAAKILHETFSKIGK